MHVGQFLNLRPLPLERPEEMRGQELPRYLLPCFTITLAWHEYQFTGRNVLLQGRTPTILQRQTRTSYSTATGFRYTTPFSIRLERETA